MAEKRVSMERITDQAFAITKKYIRKEPEAVLSVENVNEEWRVTVEALERRAIPDSLDLLGRYEIRLNRNGELIGWTQKIIRRRCDVTSSAQAEKAVS